MPFLTSLYSPGNIMDRVDIDNLTIEQYLRMIQESQTPKKIEDMTIAKYVEYEKKVNENHISNTKAYLPTYFGKSTSTHDPIQEFVHYFGPNQPGAESDYDSEDMEEEVEYKTDDEVVMSEQEESNQGYTQNIQHFEEMDDVDEWLNAKITKHTSMQGVKNMKDALISIIKSIRQERKDDIMKKQFEASTASIIDETSSIASNEVDNDDNNTTNTASYQLPKERSLGSFLLLFNIDNHSFYAITTLDDKDNIMPLKVYEYLGLDKFRVKRWHLCKPIHVTYDDGSGEDCGMWPTCDLDSKFCFGYNEVFGVNKQGSLRLWICFRDHERRTVKGSYMGFADFLQVRYGQQKIDATTREQSYDVEEEYAREIGNPYSRRFDEYKRVFNNEIEHLSNEYILRIGKKGYVLDDVWEKRQQNYKKTNEAWHDEGYEEDEMWQSRDEKTDYYPPIPWVSPVHVVPKKGGTTVIANKDNKLILTRTVTGWRIDQMLERLLGNEYYCFLDGFFGYFQIPLAPEEQENTTFTCPYGTFAYKRMPFGLCNAPATFQRCMTAIFHDMFKEGIVLGHKISKAGIEVDKVKVDVIASLPYPTNIKGKHRFLQLNQLDEFRTHAYEHSRAYKERTKRWHNSKIMDKEFQEGEENPEARRQLPRPARLIIMW
ncbi:hypothetical protein Tco_0783358 [Tanacetum coccineum]